MAAATKTTTVRSVLERFERVANAKRLPNHQELEDLAEIAAEIRDAADELVSAIEDFQSHVETLVDEDGDRDEKRDARDELPTDAQTIYDKLDIISANTVKPDATIRL